MPDTRPPGRPRQQPYYAHDAREVRTALVALILAQRALEKKLSEHRQVRNYLLETCRDALLANVTHATTRELGLQEMVRALAPDQPVKADRQGAEGQP